MGMFVISKRNNGEYKFVYTTRKGKTIFTSISYKHKPGCERLIEGIRDNFEQFTITKNTAASGKHFFRLSKDGFVLATSRKYTTPLLLQKGIDEIGRFLHRAEVLDFSENEFVFPNADEVFASEENA